LSQWLSIATNSLTADGDFTITLTNAAGSNVDARQFFILQAQ
jgi:hypothetical protein